MLLPTLAIWLISTLPLSKATPISTNPNTPSILLPPIPKRNPIDPGPPPTRASGENGLIGGLYMCTLPQFKGTCSHARYDMHQCYNLGPPFASNVSSFGPDQYAGAETFMFKCSLWDQQGCTGTKLSQRWPGTINVALDQAGQLEKKAKSLMCEFLNKDGLEMYRAWKAQGYDFDKEVERPRKCESFCT